jgi:thymidylate kinase
MLIVLEGGDGAGTTTLQTGLTKALTSRGYHVTTTHQPNRETQVGGVDPRDSGERESASTPSNGIVVCR